MKADAIHPGQLLSENACLVKLLPENDTLSDHLLRLINRMGNKSEARNTCDTGWSSVVPGSKKSLYTQQRPVLWAAKETCLSGYDKGFSGGGGKEMRISRSEEDFTEHFNAAC